MKPDPETLRRWLAAEARACDAERGAEEAEKALLRLFRALPSPVPPAGFAERVLARAGVTGAAAGVLARPPVGRIWRWAVAACVALVGLSSLLWLPVAAELLGQVRWWAPVELAGDAVRVLTNGIHRGVVVWEFLARISAAVGHAATRPPVAASLAGAVLVAVLAFRLLLELTTATPARDRSWTHA